MSVDDHESLKKVELARVYSTARELYEAFSTNLADLIANLLRVENLIHLPLEVRTKTLESFSEKIERPTKVGKYNKLADITDLSGIRIVVFYEKDVDLVCKLIESEFAIDTENSLRKDIQLDPDRFGYLSTHYVASHNKQRSELKENIQFKDFKAEIQIRTVVQHAWATIDRSLRYNNDEDIPNDVKRKLFRVSALLELADQEFSAINKIILQLRLEYAQSVQEGSLAKVKINKDSMEVFLSESTLIDQIYALAESQNTKLDNRFGADAIASSMVRICGALKLESIEDFRLMVQNCIDANSHAYDAYHSSTKSSLTRKSSKLAWLVKFLVLKSNPKTAKQILSVIKFDATTQASFEKALTANEQMKK